MASLPVVGSGVNITRIEVWLVNLQANTQDVRNAIAFTDLGEAPEYMSSDLTDGAGGLPLQDNVLFDNSNIAVTTAGNPSNLNNDIYLETTGTDPSNQNSAFSQAVLSGSQAIQALSTNTTGGFSNMQNGTHFERVNNMRKLTPTEFTYNTRLGFISLKQSLNNAEVLAVAYEFTRWICSTAGAYFKVAEAEHYACKTQQQPASSDLGEHDEERILAGCIWHCS
jgi:cell surface protein SprA